MRILGIAVARASSMLPANQTKSSSRSAGRKPQSSTSSPQITSLSVCSTAMYLNSDRLDDGGQPRQVGPDLVEPDELIGPVGPVVVGGAGDDDYPPRLKTPTAEVRRERRLRSDAQRGGLERFAALERLHPLPDLDLVAGDERFHGLTFLCPEPEIEAQVCLLKSQRTFALSRADVGQIEAQPFGLKVPEQRVDQLEQVRVRVTGAFAAWVEPGATRPQPQRPVDLAAQPCVDIESTDGTVNDDDRFDFV